MRAILLAAALLAALPAYAQEVASGPVDTSGLATQASIDAANARLTALEAKSGLVSVASGTVGETAIIGLGLGVRRYTIAAAGTTTADRIVVALTGAPTNCTVQDAYVSTAGTISVGTLVPALSIGAVIACPIIAYAVR